MLQKCDIYAFGLLMWEMAAGQHPWAGMADVAIIEAVTENCQIPPLPARAPSALKVRAACLMLVTWCSHGGSQNMQTSRCGHHPHKTCTTPYYP